ncbi:unnamed protein product [Trichogramma brassicae]|uniref:LRRCT domain-containing protein n=1 Tax=Trichogramma brassicae TaxID=86971 RepID=A0A6H5HVU6_9HYME|nr:unnamed protein product [Trichogramma brassicae]
MSGLLYTLLSFAASTSLHCAVRREISPCTCRQEDFSAPISNPPLGSPLHGERIEVECEKMESFNQVAEALRGRFTPEQSITLRVSHSYLKDISRHGFKDLKMSITRLELNYDKLGVLNGEIFAGLGRTQYLSLADNEVPSIPRPILSHLSLLRTLDLSRNRISRIEADDFKLHEDDFIEAEMLEDLQLGHNALTSLGGVTSVTPEETTTSNSALYPLKSLKCLNLTHNNLREFSFTSIRGLRELKMLDLSNNKIQRLTRGRAPTENLVEVDGDEMAGAGIQDMHLQHNELRSLEGSLFLGMRQLQRLNLSHNALGPTVGLRDLKGLDGLRKLDLSYNELTTLEDTSEVTIHPCLRTLIFFS